MKAIYWVPLVLGSCAGVAIPATVEPEINQCSNPPEGIILSDGSPPAHLIDCANNEEHTCCAYGFLPNHQYVCFHVLCRPVTCEKEWQYIKTICPPPPTEDTEVSWPKSEQPNPEYQLNPRKFRT